MEVVLVLSLLLHQVDPLGELAECVDPLGELAECVDPALIQQGRPWVVQWRGRGHLLRAALLLHGIHMGLLLRGLTASLHWPPCKSSSFGSTCRFPFLKLSLWNSPPPCCLVAGSMLLAGHMGTSHEEENYRTS